VSGDAEQLVDFHLEHGLRLHTEPEHKNLKWAINEIDAQGQQIGRDQIPWKWTLSFTATSCLLCDSIAIKPKFQIEEQTPAAPETVQDQIIRVQLRPGVAWEGQTTFSMFGTDRAIKSFELNISPIADPAKPERCGAWGSVSYTADVDFENVTTDDCIVFYLSVKPETFARYVAKVAHGLVDEMVFSVGSVDGFYSASSHSISTSNVKVLTGHSEQKITLPPGHQVEPPGLGRVGKAELYINRRLEFGKRPPEPEAVEEMADIETAVPETPAPAAVDPRMLPPTINSGYAPDEAAFAKARRSAIDDAVLDAHHDVRGEAEQKRILQSSQNSPYYKLLRGMAEAAQAFAISKQQAVDRFDLGILQDVIRVCEDVHSAFHPSDLTAKALNIPKSRDRPDLVWQHVDRLDYHAKIADVPYVDREPLLQAVGQYLNLPIRFQTMDRILIDSMVAASILHFSSDTPLTIVVDISSIPKNFRGSIEAWQRVVLIKNSCSRIAYTVLFFGGIAAAAFYFASVEVYSLTKPAVRAMAEWFSIDNWRLIGWLFASIALLDLAKIVGSARRKWAALSDGERRTNEILQSMLSTYDQLGSVGPVSAVRVRELATKAADKGAKWPPPLFALLDDIVARGDHIR
jgi:hypothetical protein